MGMYCCCDEKISSDNFVCQCDWEGWISTCDWPEDRKNRDIPFSLPEKDGIYLVRYQDNSGDRHECEKKFSVEPKIVKGGCYGPRVEFKLHWEGECWEEGKPYAWKEIKHDNL